MTEEGKTLVFSQLMISLKIDHPDHAFLNPHFLATSGIVPASWEISEFLVVSGQTTEVKFDNGMSIVGSKGTIMFVERLHEQPPEASMASGMARRFVATLPDLGYRAVVSGFTGDLILSKGEWDRVAVDNLSCKGPWLQFHGRTGGATARMCFSAEGITVGLSGDEDDRMWLEHEGTTVVSFDAEFERPVPRKGGVQPILKCIDLWESDLMTLEAFVYESFVFGT
ncbi:MAG: hypothetical protein AB1646_22875 [Thermodesulfobacteriota bacterium]